MLIFGTLEIDALNAIHHTQILRFSLISLIFKRIHFLTLKVKAKVHSKPMLTDIAYKVGELDIHATKAVIKKILYIIYSVDYIVYIYSAYRINSVYHIWWYKNDF